MSSFLELALNAKWLNRPIPAVRRCSKKRQNSPETVIPNAVTNAILKGAKL